MKLPPSDKISPKIPLYAIRTMSEKINATFDFVKENWRIWLKLSFYLLLPVSIIQGMGVHNIISAMAGDTAFPYVGIAIAVVFSLIGVSLVAAIVLVLLKWYDTHDDRLQGVTLTTMRSMLIRYFAKSLLAWFIAVVLFIPGSLLSTVMSIVIPVLLLLYVAAMLPLGMIPAIYNYEDVSCWKAFGKAFKLGYKRWGALIGLFFAIWVTVMALQGITTIPWYVSLGFKIYLESDSPSWAYMWKVFIDVMAYVMTIVQCFATYLGTAFMLFALTYHYTSVATELDSATIDAEIEHFDQL